VVLWSREVGESASLFLWLFLCRARGSENERGVERRGWVGSGVLVVSPLSPLLRVAPLLLPSLFFLYREAAGAKSKGSLFSRSLNREKARLT